MRLAPESLPQRKRMIRSQIVRRGIRNQRVLAALAWAPREWFLSRDFEPDAYRDGPLPIGNGQTISQPFIVALMTDALVPRRRQQILEIGTGSGYQTAVLAHLVRHVSTIERLPDLLVEAEVRFERLGLTNITTKLGDGAAGWPEQAPFDGIIVTAAAPRVPEPLLSQVAVGGRIVLPIGDQSEQELVILERTVSGWHERSGGGVRFVPLVSRLAFPAESSPPS
ncbi:MAG TPA: protein-L-isoaspartate(D-aspartate) O-methyltransferase [Gemmatimonadales bacterium]|nr:protein-L-isoaspartate(D-aspartate) O-methyltransferase [Gemmatimonadales bacterium]